jgi:TRAP-type mannitol/chloroaromatic compound transport system substrate-binding protein
MQIGTLLKTTTAALLVGGILGVSGLAGDAAAQDKRVKWKMGSAFPSKLVQLGSLGVSLQDKVERISGGNIQLKFFEPHALVPPLEMFDAISAGSLDAAWSTPGYWFGKEKALALFAAVPFGPSAGEYGAWMYYGGGKQLMDEIYAKHNIKSLTCGVIAPEASGWFRKEIKSVDDLKGLKMRFFGLGAKVMEKIGVSTQLIAGTRRSSVARSTPRNTQCRRSTWISASIRSPSTTTSRAGTSSRPCSS